MSALTLAQCIEFRGAVKCFICDGELNADRVHNHDHLTGQYRGAAHSQCNVNYTTPKFLPVVLHNLSGYDSHFIVRVFGADDGKIDLIPNNKERYISFSKRVAVGERERELRFIDSLRFMSSGIDKLAANLKSEQFIHIRQMFTDDSEFELVTRKGVFPYEYVDCVERLDEPTLPAKASFHSTLNSSHISDSEYKHAQNVWQQFKIKTLGEYSDLYLKTDVLLLADIFENFRNVCVGTYDLDPCQYYTAPGLSWDAMLKYTKVQLKLLTDTDQMHLIKKGMRGGLSQCSHRYAKANNKYLPNYDSSQPSKYIVYLDANNQYGWSMIQFLPINNFEWLTESEISALRIEEIDHESDKEFILEVDIEYPAELHDHHNYFPFCPETMKPPYITSKTHKLIANVYSKTKYVIHYRNLQQCMKAGLKKTKIHRVLQFHQSLWLKSYIDLNNNLRTTSTSAFERDFYKLMNNSVFGKTMVNVDKRVNVKLITRWENVGKTYGANNLIAKPNFHSCSIIKEDLVVIQMNRLRVTYNKPIYVGFTVLEVSKTLMYEFHYDYVKTKYNDHAKLLYTDTDSFIYEIATDDFYADIKSDLSRYDTSDYSVNNIYGLPRVNKKVLGKFKDECSGTIITEFVGTKAKSYCKQTADDLVIKKIKGIKKGVVNREVSVGDYRNCVLNNSTAPFMRQMVVFRSLKHNLYTHLVNKLTLSSEDDKRFVIPDSTDTLAWGNTRVENYYFT